MGGGGEEDVKEEVSDLEQNTAGRQLLDAIQHGGQNRKRKFVATSEVVFIRPALN